MIKRASSILAIFTMVTAAVAQQAAKVAINGDSTEINGHKIFAISVAVLPPADGKTPGGKSAWQEFSDAGVNLARIVPSQSGENYGWTDQGYKVARQYLDGLASAHMYAWLWLGDDIAHFTEKETAKADKLKKLVETFKDHPALAFWKGEDEPLWGQINAKEPGTKTPDKLALPYKMIHELHHQYSAPFGLAAEYASPIEVMMLGFGTVGCPILWCALTGDLHILTIYTWIFLRLCQAIDAHSGYEFPWSLHNFLPFWAGADHHDVHEQGVVGP